MQEASATQTAVVLRITISAIQMLNSVQVAFAEQAVRNYEARRATASTPAASGAAASAAPAVGPTPP